MICSNDFGFGQCIDLRQRWSNFPLNNRINSRLALGLESRGLRCKRGERIKYLHATATSHLTAMRLQLARCYTEHRTTVDAARSKG
jgi:hypothetical protein